MRHFARIWTAIILFVIASCDSSDEPVRSDNGSEYFPLKVGMYQVYDVNEIRYVLGDPDTSLYQLKLQVVDSFQTDGGFAYVIYRSTRNSTSASWKYLDTWSGRITDREAILNEGNVPFQKLALPVTNGHEWNGNAFNSLEDDEYLLDETGISQTIGTQTFPDCISVVQSDNEDFVVFLDQRKEIYARGVGLVLKETTQLNYCTTTTLGCLGKRIVESGVIYKQIISDHGVE